MKRFVSALLVASMLSSTALAATTSSIQSQINKTKTDIKSTQNELNNVKEDKKLTLSDIDKLDKQIGSAENQITTLENDISNLENEITIAEENIKYSEEAYAKKDATRQERLVAYYKCGTLSFWDTLLASESMTDFFYRYKLMDEIVSYDNQLLQELEDDKKEIENQKVALENNKTTCENKKQAAETQRLALKDTKEVRVTYLSKLEKTEDLLEESIDELQKKADALTEELKKISSSSSNSKYTGGTMTWPLPGYYTITSPFGNRLHPVLKVYKMHTGVDIAGAGCNGKNVVAANDGTVIHAGWISGYGYTVMIDHGGGIVTLYAHSQKLLVSKGDKVKRGQAIMLVGSTGYATGPHVHFEVRVNGKYVNPTQGYISAK